MSDKTVVEKCIYCKRNLTVGEAVYCVNVKLTDEAYGNYHRGRKLAESFRLIFKNSKNPKGAMHRHCWDNLMGNADKPEKIVLTNKAKLDTIE